MAQEFAFLTSSLGMLMLLVWDHTEVVGDAWYPLTQG